MMVFTRNVPPSSVLVAVGFPEMETYFGASEGMATTESKIYTQPSPTAVLLCPTGVSLVCG